MKILPPKKNQSFLNKDNGKAHCPSAGTACIDAVKELSWDVSKDRQSQKNSCSKIFYGKHKNGFRSECQTVWIQIRLNMLSGSKLFANDISRQQKSSQAGKELIPQLSRARQDTFDCLVSQNVDYRFYPEYFLAMPVVKFEQLRFTFCCCV